MDAGCQESGEQGSRAGPVGGVGGGGCMTLQMHEMKGFIS